MEMIEMGTVGTDMGTHKTAQLLGGYMGTLGTDVFSRACARAIFIDFFITVSRVVFYVYPVYPCTHLENKGFLMYPYLYPVYPKAFL